MPREDKPEQAYFIWVRSYLSKTDQQYSPQITRTLDGSAKTGGPFIDAGIEPHAIKYPITDDEVKLGLKALAEKYPVGTPLKPKETAQPASDPGDTA